MGTTVVIQRKQIEEYKLSIITTSPPIEIKCNILCLCRVCGERKMEYDMLNEFICNKCSIHHYILECNICKRILVFRNRDVIRCDHGL